MAKSKKKHSPLKDESLQSVTGGSVLGSVRQGLKRGVSELEDTFKDAKKTLEKTGSSLGTGILGAGKGFIDGFINSGKDLFQGRVGDSLKDLVEGPVTGSKAAADGLFGAAESLIEGTVDTGRDLLKATINLGTLGLGDTINLTPKIDGFIDGLASGINSSTTAVGKLANDTVDTAFDLSSLPATALATAFADATHGNITTAMSDVLTVPIAISHNDAKLLIDDLTDPQTIFGLLNTAGVIATFATFGAAAPEELAIAGASTVAAEPEALAVSRLSSLEQYLPSMPETVQTQFAKVQQLAAAGISKSGISDLNFDFAKLTNMLKNQASPEATALRISIQAIQQDLIAQRAKKSG